MHHDIFRSTSYLNTSPYVNLCPPCPSLASSLGLPPSVGSQLLRVLLCVHITAGLPIRCTMRLRWHFRCRGPISNPRPVLDFPAQTTRGKVLEFFVKPENKLVTLVFGVNMFSRGFLETKSALWAQIGFLVSRKHMYYECKSSSLNTLFEENRASTKLWLVRAGTILSSVLRSAWLP